MKDRLQIISDLLLSVGKKHDTHCNITINRNCQCEVYISGKIDCFARFDNFDDAIKFLEKYDKMDHRNYLIENKRILIDKIHHCKEVIEDEQYELNQYEKLLKEAELTEKLEIL